MPREKQLRFQVDRWFSPSFLEQDPAEVERVSRIFTGTDSQAHAAACRALGAYDDSARLGEITAPTLVLVGEDDYATPPAMAEALHVGISGSRFHVLSEVRHLSLVENPHARALARAPRSLSKGPRSFHSVSRPDGCRFRWSGRPETAADLLRDEFFLAPGTAVDRHDLLAAIKRAATTGVATCWNGLGSRSPMKRT